MTQSTNGGQPSTDQYDRRAEAQQRQLQATTYEERAAAQQEKHRAETGSDTGK